MATFQPDVLCYSLPNLKRSWCGLPVVGTVSEGSPFDLVLSLPLSLLGGLAVHCVEGTLHEMNGHPFSILSQAALSSSSGWGNDIILSSFPRQSRKGGAKAGNVLSYTAWPHTQDTALGQAISGGGHSVVAFFLNPRPLPVEHQECLQAQPSRFLSPPLCSLSMQSPLCTKPSPFVGFMSLDWSAVSPESQRLEDINFGNQGKFTG